MPFTLKLSDSRDYPIIAEQIKIPSNTNITWDTEILFDDGVDGFVTINGKFMKLQSGQTIQYSYEHRNGRNIDKLSWSERLRPTVFNFYVCRKIITGCSVGLRDGILFTDVEDGQRKKAITYWEYSLNVEDSQRLVEQVANLEEKRMNSFQCSEMFRDQAGLAGILLGVLGEYLSKYSLDKVRIMNNDVAHEVKERFIKNEGPEITGFSIMSFVIGTLSLQENYYN